ncbi:MAG: HAD-IIIC family phosphatase [Sediminibacterium sp.]
MKKLIMDLDDTICSTLNGDYTNSKPNLKVIDQLKSYKNRGFEIVIHSSRNMRTYDGKIGKINVHTLPKIINWLTENQVPFDEVIVGKPWCGFDGFYVDDRSIRPSEFLKFSYDEIKLIIDKEAHF